MTPLLLALLMLVTDPAEERPAKMTYAAPEVGEGDPAPAPADYQLPEWQPATHLFVSQDDVLMLAEPAPTARLVAKLPIGAPVAVKQVGSAVEQRDGRVDRWYEVDAPDGKSGWIFGACLTTLAFEADLDGDGEEEVATVSFSPGFRILVRILEPETRACSSVEIRPSGEGYLSRKGGNASAGLVAAKVAGLPLLQVDSSPEACADYATTYVSYLSSGPREPGTARVALHVDGVVDPPVFSRYKVRFDPKGRAAIVTHDNVEQSEDGKTHSTKTVTRYVMKEGVFVEQPKGSSK